MTYCKINTPDGEMDAYIARPNSNDAPVLIVIQEIFGVNQEIRDRCDDYASQGFIAIAPDMFWRIEKNVNLTDQTQEEWDKAFALMSKFNPDQGVRDLQCVIDQARELDGSNGKVGTIGFCLGGKLAYMMAARTDVNASVSYYGVGLQDMADEMRTVKNPLQIHIAALDEYTPPEAQEKIIEAAKAYDLIDTFLYQDCDHAFARKGGAHFDQSATHLAKIRSFVLLNTLK